MRRLIRSALLILTLLALLTAAAPAALADSQVHTVEPGETLFRISLKYGVSIQAIQAANGITGTRIYAGQVLIIPDPNAPLPPPPQQPTGDTTYVVQPGETLFRIGLKYGIPWTTIQAANGLVGTTVYAGQTLVIPGAAPASAPAPALEPTAAPEVPAEQPTEAPPPTEVPTEAPAPTEAPPPEPTAVPAQPEQGVPQVHIVQPGETLFLIGLKYGLTWTAIAQANNLPSDHIYSGQRLVIPEKGAAPAPAPAEPAAAVVAEVAAPAPPAGDGKRFLVDLSEQRLYAYEGDNLVRTTLISSGLPQYPTVIGTFHIYLRYVTARMRGPGYDLPNVPYVMYFYQSYGLHGTYWHNNFGHPMSHGCVNMPTPEAEWAYNWSDYGTTVIVQP
jgi:LysM repeat protein